MSARSESLITIRHPASLPGVRLLSADGIRTSFPRHVHDTLCLGFMRKGIRRIQIGRQCHTIPAGTAFIIEPGVSHSCVNVESGGQSYDVIALDARALAPLVAKTTGGSPAGVTFNKPVIIDPELNERARRLFAAMDHQTGAEKIVGLLDELLNHLISRHAVLNGNRRPPSFLPGAVRRVRAYLDSHFQDRVRLEDLAAIARLSPFHFRRLFLRATGVTPHEYLLKTRVRHACELLSQRAPLAWVAPETGFADQSHFSRCFKRVMGVSPGKFVVAGPGAPGTADLPGDINRPGTPGRAG